MNDIERLKKAVRIFDEAGIRFVLIGGLAMIAHGCDILTQDIDFAYSLDPQNIDRLAEFLPTIHARVSGRAPNDGFVITSMTLQRARFLNLYTDLGEVDVMREIPGIDGFDALWQRAVYLDLGGFTAPVASIDDLIAMKRAANRPKDQSHILCLLALRKMEKPE